MKRRSALPMRVAKYGYILFSAAFCAGGIVLMLLKTLPRSVIGVCFGTAMLLFGCVKMVGYFSKDLFRLAFQYDLQFGILFSILGAATLLKRGENAEFICVAYSMCIISGSLFRIKTAFEAGSFGIRRWRLTAVLAVLNAFVGVLIMLCRVEDVQTAKTLFGASLLTEGALSLNVALTMVKIIGYQHPDSVNNCDDELWEED